MSYRYTAYQINHREVDAYNNMMRSASSSAAVQTLEGRITQLERYLVQHLHREHHMRIREIASELGIRYTTVRLFVAELKNHGRRK